MPGHEPKLELDPVSQIRAEYEALLKKVERPLGSAEVAHGEMTAAASFFKLGVKLGKIDSAEAQALIAEIEKYTGDREKQLHEAIFPKGGLMKAQGG